MSKLSFLLAGLCLLAISAEDALAQGVDPRQRTTPGEARERVRSGEVVPMLRVTGAARQRYPNLREIIDAYLVDGGRPYYVVRLVTADGQLKELYFDARSGDFMYER